MSRPLSHDDLPDYVSNGHLVATVTADYLIRFPSLGQYLVAALAEAKRLGLDVTKDGQILLAKTPEELDKALEQHQKSWDSSADWYAEAQADPSALEKWKRSSVNHWAEREGWPAIEWPSEVTR